MIRSLNCRLSKKNRSPGDTLGSSNMDAPNPRLVSSRKANREDHIRKELSGEAAKEKGGGSVPGKQEAWGAGTPLGKCGLFTKWVCSLLGP